MMKEHEKIEGTVENWENGKLGNDERFVKVSTCTPEISEQIMKAAEKVKQLNNPNEETVRNHPHTAILASMGVTSVNGFKVNK
tara:strand:- start:140 stop:388 length:249 start_codon:yes stop_codon:yes gene_type:complete